MGRGSKGIYLTNENGSQGNRVGTIGVNISQEQWNKAVANQKRGDLRDAMWKNKKRISTEEMERARRLANQINDVDEGKYYFDTTGNEDSLLAITGVRIPKNATEEEWYSAMAKVEQIVGVDMGYQQAYNNLKTWNKQHNKR